MQSTHTIDICYWGRLTPMSRPGKDPHTHPGHMRLLSAQVGKGKGR